MNDMNKRTFLSLLLCVCSLSFLHAERVDMQQAGADIQGRKLNTALINSTIDRLMMVADTWNFPASIGESALSA